MYNNTKTREDLETNFSNNLSLILKITNLPKDKVFIWGKITTNNSNFTTPIPKTKIILNNDDLNLLLLLLKILNTF